MKIHAPISVVFTSLNLVFSLLAFNRPVGAQGGTPDSLSQTAPVIHNVILRVVRVTPSWMPYASTGGWTAAVPQKESEILRFYEAAIWEETSAVHFYAFPNDYDDGYGYRGSVSDEEKIAYREQYLISQFTDMPGAYTAERSAFLKSTFMDIVSHLVNEHPNSEHHLMYSGHGGPGGKLFAGNLHRDDANELLKHWSQSLRRPLGVIDMGGPCTKGSFSDLDNFCESARYYVASDLANGGYTMDRWTSEKHNETDPETQYHNLFFSNSSLEESLKDRVDLKRTRYEYSRNNMITNQVAQANYLYSCAEFRSFAHVFKPFIGSAGAEYGIFDDLRQYLNDNGAAPAVIEQFSKVIVHQADNKDFFEWSVVRNGMLMPDPEHFDLQSPRPQALAKVFGDGQEAGAGTVLEVPLTVEVRDQNGNVLAGATVFFDVTGGGGSLSTTIATTDATGRSFVTLTLGPHSGANTVEVTSGGLSPVNFTVEALATADFNGDGRTDFVDFFLFADAYGGTDARFDLDGNGTVDFADFFRFVDAFGT